MKVFTYFRQDPKLPPFNSLITLWEQKWKDAGYEPVVLREEPREHPLFQRVFSHVEGLPTINPRVYTTNDFIRWLAMEEIGGGLHVDSDVFPGKGLPDFPNTYRSTTVFGPSRCPCAVWVCPMSARKHQVARMILGYNVEHAERLPQGVHCSDQGFFRWWKPDFHFLCPNASDPLSKNAPMTHYCTQDTSWLPGGSKGEKVKRALTLGLPLVVSR